MILDGTGRASPFRLREGVCSVAQFIPNARTQLAPRHRAAPRHGREGTCGQETAPPTSGPEATVVRDTAGQSELSPLPQEHVSGWCHDQRHLPGGSQQALTAGEEASAPGL